MNRSLFISKVKAFSAHFGLSLFIFFILLYLILFHWYPPPFFSTDGGWQGLRIIVFVDLVLGPLLTFVIFNPAKVKRLLIMDLSIIGLCQAIALSWGIWATHNERPYLLVFADGIFYPLTYYQIGETGLSMPEIKKLSTGNPPYKIYADVPQDKIKYLALLTQAAKDKPIHFMGSLYRKFDSDKLAKISLRSIDMQAYLSDEPPEWQREYQDFVNTNGQNIDKIFFLPLKARYGKYILAFDKVKMEFIDVLDIPPPDIDEVIYGKAEAKKRREKHKKNTLLTPKK